MMNYTKLQIINMALTLLGARPLTAIGDGSPQDKVFDRVYDITRDMTILSGSWAFATTQKQLTNDDWATSTVYTIDDLVVYDDTIYKCITSHTSGTTFDDTKWTEFPLYDYDYVYKVPDDSLKIMYFKNFVKYTRQGQYILTDTEEPYITYVKQVTDETDFDYQFLMAFIAKLASVSCQAITNNDSLGESYYQKALYESGFAMSIDSQESGVVTIEESSWVNGRN